MAVGSAADHRQPEDKGGCFCLQETHIMCRGPLGDGDPQGIGRRHMGNSCKVLSAQIAEPLNGGRGHAVGKTVGYDGREKERQGDDERVPPNCNAPDDVPPFSKILQQLAGQAMRTRGGPQYGHVPGRQAHEVGFHPAPHGGTSNGVADTNFRGCDVAAAFDHVSHHVIIGAMEALKVPPVFVAAWIRECRGDPKLLPSWTTS